MNYDALKSRHAKLGIPAKESIVKQNPSERNNSIILIKVSFHKKKT
jgi:hypothetical protein